MTEFHSPPHVKKASTFLRWRELRAAYPRAAYSVALVVVLLLVADAVIVGARIKYGTELARMRSAMTAAEERRVDAIEAAEENRLAMAVELARREALGDRELHLSVDAAKGIMCLEREGALLREMSVRFGPEATVGSRPDAVHLAPPRGKRTVTRVVDGSFRWSVPEWVFRQRRLPVPGDRLVDGALGPVAIFLDSGAVIYSMPATGPLNDAAYVMPGSLRAEAADLQAIRANLQPGMALYFH